MAKPGKRGLSRIVDATGYSWSGLRSCWKQEAAFRQEVNACIVLVPAACYFGETGLEMAVLLGTCWLVLIVEILNSGIEAVVDRIGHEHHDLSGLAKDLGSAAVAMSIGMFLTVWALILFF